MRFDLEDVEGLFNLVGPQHPFLSFTIQEKYYNDFKQASKQAYGVTRNNQNLAGNIKHEYKIYNYISEDTKSWLKKTASNYFLNHSSLQKTYERRYSNNTEIRVNPNFTFTDEVWVNFQKKYEFNPIHNHAGVISWVLWLDIPYDIEEEKAKGPGATSNSNTPGHFIFVFNDQHSIITIEIPADKKYNGRILFFPSTQCHCVHPFYTSDDYRVSISGNLLLDDSRKE